MARKLVAVEITLVSCSLLNTLKGRGKESTHLLQSSLVWPRAGIASRSSSSRVDLVAGQCDLHGESWTRRIVFKENVEATFGIKVDVSEALGNEAVEEFLRFMAGTVMSLGADVVDDMVPAGAVAAAPLDYFSKKIKQMPDADIIASGCVDVDVDKLSVSGDNIIRMALASPREVVKQSRRTVNRKTKTIRKVLMRKDEPNGEVTLAIRLI